jgi:hypothetical protein
VIGVGKCKVDEHQAAPSPVQNISGLKIAVVDPKPMDKMKLDEKDKPTARSAEFSLS